MKGAPNFLVKLNGRLYFHNGCDLDQKISNNRFKWLWLTLNNNQFQVICDSDFLLTLHDGWLGTPTPFLLPINNKETIVQYTQKLE